MAVAAVFLYQNLKDKVNIDGRAKMWLLITIITQ